MEPQLRHAVYETAGEHETVGEDTRHMAQKAKNDVPVARQSDLADHHATVPRPQHGNAAVVEADDAAGPSLGAEVVVRTAGFPIGLWTASGAAELFHEIAELFQERTELLSRAHDLAERVSDEVIPNPQLGKEDRRAALLLRRRLHKGDVPNGQEFAHLATTESVPQDIGAALHWLMRRAEHHQHRYERDSAKVAAERDRVLALPWQLVRDDPAGRFFLDEEAATLCTEIERRLGAGEQWSGKRLRHRADYLWRIVARGAAKTTPRSWLGHVAPLRVGSAWSGSPSSSGFPHFGLEEVTTESVENLHSLRSRLDGISLRDADASTPLALASLRMLTETEFRCFSLDTADATTMREVKLRNTAALRGVVAALRDGTRPLGELLQHLLGTGATDEQLGKIRAFLAHLQELGVVRVCATPRRWIGEWGDLRSGRASAVSSMCGTASLGTSDTGKQPESSMTSSFVDVHRRVTADTADGGLADSGGVPQLAAALSVAERLAGLREADREPQRMDLSTFVSTEPRPSTEVLQGLLSSDVDLSRLRQREQPGWHRPNYRRAGYAQLLDDVRARIDDDEVDVSEQRLDELGAPDTVERAWPVDALVRPVNSERHLAVLGVSAPAGSLDARFADTFAAAHGYYGNVERYREFLAAVERHTGARFIELLFPPSHERAANAVCRPIYTRAWTGDVDRHAYHREAARDLSAEYVPLERIMLRGTDDRVFVETDDGTPLLPVYHATRPPLPPYDLLLHVLLAGGPTSTMRMTRLDRLACAFPEANHVPRMTVSGRLVVSPETWRVPIERLWDPADSDMVKMDSVVALRRALGIPRWVFVSPESDGKAVPVDLDALPGLRTVERVVGRESESTPLLFEEMIPDPNHLSAFGPTAENGAEYAAELLVRLPHEQGVRPLARRAAESLRRNSIVQVAAARS